MSEEIQEPVAEQAIQDSTPQPTHDEVTLLRHGKEHIVTAEKAKELAQMGFDYSQKMADLKTEREAFGAERQQLEGFKQLRAHLEANPQAQKAVQYALEQTDLVVQSVEGGADSISGEWESTEENTMDNRKLQSLQTDVANVTAKLEASEALQRQQALQAQVETEIASYPWLEGKRADLARTQAQAIMTTEGETAIAAVARTAGQVREAMEVQQAKQLEDTTNRQSLKTVDPNAGTPAATPAKEFKKDDLFNGNILKQAMAAVKGIKS